MKASRPLGGGITYADTRPPACEISAHPRDRDSGGTRLPPPLETSFYGDLGAFLRSADSENREIDLDALEGVRH